ncbi:hypothetical protein F2Q69_00062826 [Brassica cretica]|uniref:Uncharacterized protein n=2 Tax=Brassica cretica TaxID=69181 RepID=A0A8S9RQU5_BRACR|nr:hypothetical protein DY000_02057189 [Brassica cretica]KAF3575066.1 hypothetical protein F2Q69_00062826 [Brassica cretica]
MTVVTSGDRELETREDRGGVRWSEPEMRDVLEPETRELKNIRVSDQVIPSSPWSNRRRRASTRHRLILPPYQLVCSAGRALTGKEDDTRRSSTAV